jgi:two-component system OmpR family sensor kinase
LIKSLAGRLVLGVVALVVVLVASTGTATYVALRLLLIQRLDQQLTSIANENALARLTSPNPHAGSPLVKGPQEVWVAELDTAGAVLGIVSSADETVHPLKLRSSDQKWLVSHLGRVRTVVNSDGERLRVQSVPVTFRALDDSTGQESNQHGVAVVGLSTNDIRTTLQKLILVEIGIGAVAVALSAGLTTYGVRAGLRPLHRVARTAQEVTDELGPDGSGLQRRVPDADPATEVGQVASSVNTLLEAVETQFAARIRSEERMRQFLADASHELRTPLTSIRGYAELSRLQGGTSDAIADSLGRIEVEGTRMSRLIEDLLVLARGDQDTAIRTDPVDVDSLLAEAVGGLRAAHPDRSISVGESGGAVVLGDRDQLLRLLLNLLTNAAGHTAAGGPIRLEAALSQLPGSTGVATKLQDAPGASIKPPDRPGIDLNASGAPGASAGLAGVTVVVIRVIDSGPGLQPDEAPHVFERFWRADKARSRAKGGSGLGLAIVAQIVRSHHGTVQFDSRVETGTTVTVTLPAAPVTR